MTKVNGFVVGQGAGLNRETLNSELMWYKSQCGREWIHTSIPNTENWEFQPEWLYFASAEADVWGRAITVILSPIYPYPF